jgi:hypothetical protein
MQKNQNNPLASILITPVVLISSHKQKKLTTIENNPRVKKVIGKAKNCKIGLIKKLIKLSTIKNIPTSKSPPTSICGNRKSRILRDKKEISQ